jgi:hypothetical protein
VSDTIPYSKVKQVLALLDIADPTVVTFVRMDAHEIAISYITDKARLGLRGGLLLEEVTKRIDYSEPHPDAPHYEQPAEAARHG